MKSKESQIKNIFLKIANREIDPDWSEAANAFIEWNIERDFKTESFNQFVEWLDDDQIESVWTFFFGYYNDYERFSSDWVELEEKQDYLNYALTSTSSI